MVRFWLPLVLLFQGFTVPSARRVNSAPLVTRVESASAASPTIPAVPAGCGFTTTSVTNAEQLKTTGASSGTVTLSSSGTNAVTAFETPASDPGLTAYPAGTWTISLDVTTTNARIVWNNTCVVYVTSAGAVGGVIGSATSSTALNTATPSNTVSGSAVASVPSTDQIVVYIQYVKSGGGGTQSATITLGNSSLSTITSPL